MKHASQCQFLSPIVLKIAENDPGSRKEYAGLPPKSNRFLLEPRPTTAENLIKIRSQLFEIFCRNTQTHRKEN